MRVGELPNNVLNALSESNILRTFRKWSLYELRLSACPVGQGNDVAGNVTGALRTKKTTCDVEAAIHAGGCQNRAFVHIKRVLI